MAETQDPQTPLSSAGLSSEELVSLLAVSGCGVAGALHHVLLHIRSYQELLAEDVRDRPSALRNLEAMGQALESGQRWLKSFEAGVQGASGELEELDLCVLLRGIRDRQKAILESGNSIALAEPRHCADCMVRGDAFQLQELFMKLFGLGFARHTALRLEISISSEGMRECGIHLGEDVVRVTICAEECKWNVDAQVPFLDALVGTESSLAPVPGSEQDWLDTYGVARNHGGELLLQMGETGVEGFSVVLPMATARGEMRAPQNLESEKLRGSETILLVDDEDAIWDVVMDMLQGLGYSVILAGNGREAVETYSANMGMIDVVLLDMIMPEMSGYEAFHLLQKIDPDVKVLLSSGYVSQTDAQELLDAGALGFMKKPYRMRDLALRLREVLDSSVP